MRVGGGFQHLVDYLWDRLDKQCAQPLSAAAAYKLQSPELHRVIETTAARPSKESAAPLHADPRVSALQRKLRQKHRTASELFACDVNRDDRLNLEEFSQGIAMMGVRPLPSPADMRALFEAYDGIHPNTCAVVRHACFCCLGDGDGWIEWDEVHEMFGGRKTRGTGQMVATVKSTLARS